MWDVWGDKALIAVGGAWRPLAPERRGGDLCEPVWKGGWALLWFKEVPPLGFFFKFLPEVRCCFKCDKLWRKAHIYENTFSSKVAWSPSGTAYPARGAAGKRQLLLPRKGRFIESDLSGLQIFHKCALLRCCYLTTGIWTCSPAGFATLAHWQVGAIDAIPTRPWLWKGHARPGKACPLHFKNSRNQILSVTVTNRATGDTA